MNNPIAKDFAKWVKNAVVPDETFFPSLNHNPHLKVPGSALVHIQTNTRKPYIARFKNWGAAWGDGIMNWPCKGKRVRDICIFGVGDLRLLTSRMELFANKFYINYQPRTFECIEEWLRERAMNGDKQNNTIDYEYYRNMEYLKYIYRNGTLV
ncbi:beta-1,3-galactosyl-O-glycosyl-glycoprotein beta-1,6-N-acetylglucosaminyltransferase 3-like [Haliotis rufescens]|uniref:beta-1,3-galactosyl-O-glycosyl-glycoprotein beta-1,6-N-acetylglucosaminyltransferase 3-like n=1 Tax=Haliotis rufescens TaxID=6454 RepID=UPI00201FA0AD|nr:beta-1,3-galactosyl-O-glycosyl-glycoprotein beta-1,6-N-acetylglucosaminyltransferase 3-like [Haliotis rufescens]